MRLRVVQGGRGQHTEADLAAQLKLGTRCTWINSPANAKVTGPPTAVEIIGKPGRPLPDKPLAVAISFIEDEQVQTRLARVSDLTILV